MELYYFEFVASDDGEKRDPEMRCTLCGEHLCDVEHGDTLDVIVAVADNHVCDASRTATDSEAAVTPPA